MKTILVGMVMTISFFSCTKNGVVDRNCALTAQNLSGTYKIIGARYEETPTTAPVDYMDDLFMNNECKRDDVYTFTTTGQLIISDGATNCTPATGAEKTWVLRDHKLSVQGEKEANVWGLYCEPGVLYLKYGDWVKAGDSLLVVYHR